MKNILKAKDRITGEIVVVVYAHNKKGNLRFHIGNKSISDRQFDKKYILVQND